ncbi:glycosyltransferase (plasmid) [Halolamina sp. CBA1230]|uniref:glycosyltransferase n=1 Tax=Halolamina sp. CBA1230 TaxID=1853690 RepID=UPI0009A1A877|nr:glycosyltransferase [Halolamina sp. CBA1230]QKY21940.1 glycosyltransferase [Halolamina sp. CBA1230]
MRVLQLVPSADSTAYRGQVRALRAHGVDCATLAVPGDHVPGERSRSPREYLRHLASAFRVRGEFDVVHANQGVVAPTALALAGLPTVVSLWGSDLYGTLGPVSRACARLADGVVVMSTAMAAELGTDCRVIPHGVDTERFRPGNPQTARAELGWDDGHHVLFPYARERTVKNYPRAERIVDAAADRLDADVSLHAVTGVPHERMPTYFVAADALLLPSDHEGSPNAVKEALACNLPVVSTPVGDVPERLDGVTPSETAATDTGLAAALADVLARGERSNGREQVRALTRDRTARELAAVYREVLDG